MERFAFIMRKQLAKRYHYLMTGEAFNVLLFLAFYLWWVRRDNWLWEGWILRGYGVLAIVIILVQGTYLWWYKLQSLHRGQAIIEPWMARLLVKFRVFNWGLLFLYLPFIGGFWLLTGTVGKVDLFYGTLLVGFALLEQINYYYRQLMYDNRADIVYLITHKRLKQGFVARELSREHSM